MSPPVIDPKHVPTGLQTNKVEPLIKDKLINILDMVSSEDIMNLSISLVLVILNIFLLTFCKFICKWGIN